MKFIILLIMSLASISQASGIKGYIDSVTQNSDKSSTVRGWACDEGKAQSIAVHVFFGGQSGVGKLYKIIQANISNEAAVDTACSTKGIPHRFSLTVPLSDVNLYGGQFVYVHGISVSGLPNLLLNNSGRYPLARNYTPGQPQACSDQVYQSLFSTSGQNVYLSCNLTLKSTDVVRNMIVVNGFGGTNVKINCNGATLMKGLVINAFKMLNVNTNTYDYRAPQNVSVSGCTSLAQVRVSGMGVNGEDPNLTASGRQLWHTQRAQYYAPHDITFSAMKFQSQNSIQLYLSPGVHHVTVQNSSFTGASPSVAIYMDAESGFNKLLNNTIETDTSSRELIALDGSANNLISNNFFSALDHGGIYLYRNCGEGGNVRQQTSNYNEISNNHFYYRYYRGPNPSVWIAARNGSRNYCGQDAGYSIGSSINDRDLAMYNKVMNNTYDSWFSVRVDEVNNTVSSNLMSAGTSGSGSAPAGSGGSVSMSSRGIEFER